MERYSRRSSASSLLHTCSPDCSSRHSFGQQQKSKSPRGTKNYEMDAQKTTTGKSLTVFSFLSPFFLFPFLGNSLSVVIHGRFVVFGAKRNNNPPQNSVVSRVFLEARPSDWLTAGVLFQVCPVVTLPLNTVTQACTAIST